MNGLVFVSADLNGLVFVSVMPYQINFFYSVMTDEQTLIYNEITRAVERGESGVFFLYGQSGTRKHSCGRSYAHV